MCGSLCCLEYWSSALIRQQQGWQLPPAPLCLARRLTRMADTGFLSSCSCFQSPGELKHHLQWAAPLPTVENSSFASGLLKHLPAWISEWFRHSRRLSSPNPCSKRGRLEQVASWVLNITRNGDSITFLGNLLQAVTTLRVKKVLCLNRIYCLSICGYFFLSFSQPPLSRVWLCLLHPLPSGMHTHWDPPEPFFLQAEQSQLAQPLCVRQVLQSLNRVWPFAWPTPAHPYFPYSPMCTGCQLSPGWVEFWGFFES